MNERVDRAWLDPEVADQYLRDVRAAIPYGDAQIDIMLRIVAGTEFETGRMLDLGCGDGVLGRALLSRWPELRVVFADFSQNMLDAARGSLGEADRHAFVQGDYSTREWLEPLADEAPFDAVVSGYSIHHQSDVRKRALYEEILELIAPGGWFVNVEHVETASRHAVFLFKEHMLDNLMENAQRSGGSPEREALRAAYDARRDKAANVLAPIEAQLDWLREIGYVEVDCYFKAYELAVLAGRRPPIS